MRPMISFTAALYAVAVLFHSTRLVTGSLPDAIDRQSIVRRYNPTRNASSATTPMQVGNGDFAFGADITGLQTFLPFAIMSSWGWKNDTLPSNKTEQDVLDYRGVSWPTHGRPVQYMFGGEASIQSWLISNPNRVNLGRVGLLFLAEDASTPLEVTEADISGAGQTLDLWTGTLTSRFTFDGSAVEVLTRSTAEGNTVGVSITSNLLKLGRLRAFLDFPWNDGKSKFKAPFVGTWNATSNHTTTLNSSEDILGQDVRSQITNELDGSVFVTSIGGADDFAVSRDSPETHRYTVKPARNATQFAFTLAYDFPGPRAIATAQEVALSSTQGWKAFWTGSGFVDVITGSTDPRADELQRRIILSRYLMRVNEAGDTPPQESGLVNDGWYGKFHMEMIFWHWAHMSLWGQPSNARSVYNRFLPTSIQRAQVQQGYSKGARWSKMTDPAGRSAPGQINDLLLWQQPHPLVFAEYEYRAAPTRDTLLGWRTVVHETADWMADYAWWNASSGVYDLGPPMYVVSEDTAPNATRNAAFELAYWRLGLGIAERWMDRLGEPVPPEWTEVKEKLAPLPVQGGLYAVYEGIPTDFWVTEEYTNDHPALTGLLGWLPPTPGLDSLIAKATAEKVWTSWNITNCWGWDFPMLAMSAARTGNAEKAVDWLLHPLFQFDDVGMPVGGVRVPTPYFPGSGGLLYAVAMMASGWDGSNGTAPGFPKQGWNIRSEGIRTAL